MYTFLTGRKITLGEHVPGNLQKMFAWSQYEELIDIEAGDPDSILKDLEE